MLSICDIFIGDVEHEIGNKLCSKLIWGVVRIRHIPLEVLLDHQPVLPIHQFHIKPQISQVLDCLSLPGQTESRSDHTIHHKCAKIAVRVQTQFNLTLHDVYHVDAEEFDLTRI